MKIKMIFSAVAATVVLAGCAGTTPEQTTQAGSPKFSHPRDITNPYLPLAMLKQDVLKNESERVERTAKPDVHKTFQINGQTVEALAVEDREYD